MQELLLYLYHIQHNQCYSSGQKVSAFVSRIKLYKQTTKDITIAEGCTTKKKNPVNMEKKYN